MSTIVTRAGKGAPLTNTEMDSNLTNLNTDKFEIGGTYSGGTANTIPYLNGSKVLSSNTGIQFDGSNLGLGVTPSAWGASFKAIQLGTKGAFYGSTSATVIADNVYNDGSAKYLTTAAAGNYVQSGGTHYWQIAGSGTAGNPITFTQAMTLDASGRLGIGQTSPSYVLDTSDLTGQIRVARYKDNAGDMGGLLLTGLNASSAAKTYALVQSGAVSTTAGAETGYLDLYTMRSGTLTQAARIDSSGNLLVGTTSGSQSRIVKSISGDVVLRVENSLSTNPYVLELMVPTASANDTSYTYWVARNANGTNRAYLLGNGGLGNYSANNVNLSDRREKTNFAPATSYLDKICAIPVQTFNYIDQNLETDAGLTLGVVAQDVQAVAPELVTESNWGTEEEPKMRLSVYQTDLQYALMKCIQEQQAIITQLQADVAALKG